MGFSVSPSFKKSAFDRLGCVCEGAISSITTISSRSTIHKTTSKLCSTQLTNMWFLPPNENTSICVSIHSRPLSLEQYLQ